MSIKAISWAIEQDLIPLHKVIIISLAMFQNDETGRCFPSRHKLAALVNVSEATLKRHLAILEEGGWIVRTARFNKKTGLQTSNGYFINFRKGRRLNMSPLPQYDDIEIEEAQNEPPTKPGGATAEPPGGSTAEPPTTLKENLKRIAPTGADRNISPEEVSPAAAPCPPPASTPAAAIDWRNRLVQYRKRAIWAKNWGPPMHAPGCLVPPDLVREWDATQGKAFVEEEQKPAWQGRKKRDWQHASSAIN